MQARDARMLSESIVAATPSLWSVFQVSRLLTGIGTILLQTEGGRLISLLSGLTSSLWFLGAEWPRFGAMLKIIGQIAVLYFKTGMRG